MAQITHAAANMSSEWGISGFGEMETSNGVAYRGVLSRNDARAAEFSNAGDGGASRIHFIDPADRVAFEAEAQIFFPGAPEAADHLLLALLERWVGDVDAPAA